MKSTKEITIKSKSTTKPWVISTAEVHHHSGDIFQAHALKINSTKKIS